MKSRTQTAVLRLPGLRPYQKTAAEVRTRDGFVVSAPQIGKTWTGVSLIIEMPWSMGGIVRGRWPWWWAAPTYKQAEHAFEICDRFTLSAGIQRKPSRRSSPQAVFLSNGETIEFRSWERPDGLYGPTVAGGVIDEFGQLTKAAYGALSSRRAETITLGLGFYRWFGNVGPSGGIAEKLWEQAEEGAPGMTALRWTWIDRALAHPCTCGKDFAPLYPELGTGDLHDFGCPRGAFVIFIESEASNMSKAQFTRLYNAEWEDWNERPVYGFDRKRHVREDLEFDSLLELDISCDFNVDPMAWILGQHKGREAWAIDEVSIPGGATTKEACKEVIRRYPNREQRVAIYGDPSGSARKTSAEKTDYDLITDILSAYYYSFRLLVPPSHPRVVDRVNDVNAFLDPAFGPERYWVHPRCKELIKDYLRVSWKEGVREIDKRDKSRTHYTDADGYRLTALSTSAGKAKVSTAPPPKSTFVPMQKRVF